MSVRNRSRRSLLTACLTLPILTAGCDDGSCFFFALFSVDVSVVDAATGSALVDEGVRVTLQDGPYLEELRPAGDGTYHGVEDRPGTYTVTVSSPGYESWVQSDIIISKGGCDASATVVTAELTQRRQQ